MLKIKLHQTKRIVEQPIQIAGGSWQLIPGQFRVRPAQWCTWEKLRRLFVRQFETVCIGFAGGGYSYVCCFSVQEHKLLRSSVGQSCAWNQKAGEEKAAEEQTVQQKAILCSSTQFEAFLRMSFQIRVSIGVLWWFPTKRRLFGSFQGWCVALQRRRVRRCRIFDGWQWGSSRVVDNRAWRSTLFSQIFWYICSIFGVSLAAVFGYFGWQFVNILE